MNFWLISAILALFAADWFEPSDPTGRFGSIVNLKILD
jgi:hypothetical protein